MYIISVSAGAPIHGSILIDTAQLGQYGAVFGGSDTPIDPARK